MVKDKVLKTVIEDLAKEYDLPTDVIEDIYDSQWDFIVETIEDLDFNDVTEENFKTLKTNFNIPALGKFYTTYYKVKNVREKRIEAERIARNDVQQTSGYSKQEEE